MVEVPLASTPPSMSSNRPSQNTVCLPARVLQRGNPELLTGTREDRMSHGRVDPAGHEPALRHAPGMAELRPDGEFQHRPARLGITLDTDAVAEGLQHGRLRSVDLLGVAHSLDSR